MRLIARKYGVSLSPSFFALFPFSALLSFPPVLPTCHPPSLHVGEDPVQMDLWSSSVSSEPRYTLSVVDLHKRKGKNGPFAIFIVPQGRYIIM